jgi:rhamnogalacturonyl hydrolase YesR
MALARIDPERRAAYLDVATRWAVAHDWNLAYGNPTDRVADDQCCGQTYLDLYAYHPSPEKIAKIKIAIDGMVNSAKSDDWWWIDALQMAMPLFARFGVLTGDARYFEKMHALYSHTRSIEGGRGLYNPTEHLWWRDADFDPPYAEPNGANCYWSRGNGWVFAALVRVLEVLPAEAPHRAEYLATFQDMAAALAPLQRTDGFWNASLRDPDNYGGRELTGTAFFTYGFAWGIRQGHLSREAYLPTVARAWRALSALAVRPDGSLGYVQGTGKQPSDGQPVTYDSAPNFDDFGTGAFLLAGGEVFALSSTPHVDAIAVFKSWSRQADGRLSPWTQFVATVEGTGLAEAFSAVPPRLLLPDGVTSHALAPDPATGDYVYAEELNNVELDRKYPDGDYALVLDGQRLDGIRLRPDAAGARYPFYQTVTTAGSQRAQPLAFRAAAFPAAPSGEVCVRLELAHDGWWLHRDFYGATSESPALILPPFTLPEGATVSLRADFDRLSHRTRGAAIGTLGQPTIEAGYRLQVHDAAALQPTTHVVEKLRNVSARGSASATSPLMAGFTVSAGGAKLVLVRAVGPTLAAFGVGEALTNPFLRVFNANRSRAWQNDDWQSTPQYLALDPASGATTLLASYTQARDLATSAREAGAFPLGARSRDAALAIVLPPGSYTAQCTPSGNSSAGNALLEVYELATTAVEPRLINLSARGTVSAAAPLTAGFVVSGANQRVLVRVLGPVLANLGLPAGSVLARPRLALQPAGGGPPIDPEPAGASLDELRARVGAFPLPAGGQDIELAASLPPGAYTAQVTSADAAGAGGATVIEIYAEPPGS